MQETYHKFKANPPARIKRKAEKQRLEKEEAKRMREAEETSSNSAIDPITGQINQAILSRADASSEAGTPKTPSSTDTSQMNGEAKMENGGESDSNDATSTPSTPSTNTAVTNMNAGGDGSGDKPVVLLSGFGKSDLKELEKLASEVGIDVTSQPRAATHLIMPRLGRTISFLCAINYVKYIVKADWIRDSHKEKKVLGKT